MDKGNYSDEVVAFYHTSAWTHTRALVLMRDKHLCQVCLKHGTLTKANTVHHITPIRKVENGKNKKLIGWDKRLDLNNLEAICPTCHNREHPEKGYNERTREKRKQKAKIKKTNIFKIN